MTEIPEHLLKRSRERRAALGLGGDGGSDAGGGEAKPAATPATTASAAPATTPSAPAGRAGAPAVPSVPAPRPDSPVVAAYKARQRIPFWAMMALALLPIWALMYARSVTTQAREATGPLGEGEEVYGTCQSCHGGNGQGGVGYPFANGEVLKTFPHIEDQLRFVYFGSDRYEAADIDSYGNPDREGGPHLIKQFNGAPMPNQGTGTGGALTDAALLAVVCHERYTLGGADPTSPEYLEEFEQWCSEESEIFLDLEGGGDIRTLEERFEGIIAIGNEPVAGSPPSE